MHAISVALAPYAAITLTQKNGRKREVSIPSDRKTWSKGAVSTIVRNALAPIDSHSSAMACRTCRGLPDDIMVFGSAKAPPIDYLASSRAAARLRMTVRVLFILLCLP